MKPSKLAKMHNASLQLKCRETWILCIRLFPSLHGLKMPDCVFNSKLRTVAGYCMSEIDKIEFNPILFDADILAYDEIILHEFAHHVDFLINGDCPQEFWHGSQWCDIMRKLGIKKPSQYHFLEEKDYYE